jgi:hypothetical protein
LSKINDNKPKPGKIELKNLDRACAWLIFILGILDLVHTELRHPAGAVLDSGLLWVLLAMFNLLRIDHADKVRHLQTFCIGANIATLMLESVRWKMFGLSAMTGLVLAETLFSIWPVAKGSSGSSLPSELPGTPQSAKLASLDSVLTREPLGKNVPAKTWNRAVHILFYSTVLMAMFTYQLGKARGRYEVRVSDYASVKAQYEQLRAEYSSIEKENSRLESEYSDLKTQYDRIESGRKPQPKR